MKASSRTIILLVAVAASLLLVSGCTVNAQTKAITSAVVAYSDYYIEVRNLGDQVQAQAEQVDASAKDVDYTISVDIPDYTRMDPDKAGFVLPEPNVSSRSAAAYQQQATLALRQSLEQYAMKNGAEGYIQLPVTFSVTNSGGWTANMTSQSKLDIQQTIEDMLLVVLQKSDAYHGDYRIMQVSSALSDLLTESFGGVEYAEEINVTQVSPAADGSYSVSFSYPDASFVYKALGDAYVASYNQPFYGNERTAELTTEGLKDIHLTGAPQQAATVLISFDEATQAFALLDDGGLGEIVAEAKAQAQSAASAAVNAQWRTAPLEVPDNASVLEGESGGNQVVFKTGTSLGKYFYARFYAISGEDTNEEGVLQLGVFIIGGKSAKVKLPTGYYRVTCVTGESWYGLEHLFGSDMKTYNGGNAIQSRKGFINSISFE